MQCIRYTLKSYSARCANKFAQSLIIIISYARVLHHYSEFHGPSTPNPQVIHNKPITAKVKKIQFTKLILNNK